MTAPRTLTIRLATTDAELEAIYRFRYAIYVEEMHRKQKHADPLTRQICDPLDAGAYVLGVWEQEEVVGTLRTNFLAETEVGEYFDMY
jgi:N-acyl-L-homoserine lactone synthetase